jgi:hypothetical protein
MSKFKFRFKYRNVDEIRTNFRRNFDFVELKKCLFGKPMPEPSENEREPHLVVEKNIKMYSIEEKIKTELKTKDTFLASLSRTDAGCLPHRLANGIPSL